MNKCVCINNRIHTGEFVYSGRVYCYLVPNGVSMYYTLYEDVVSKDIVTIFVHRDYFSRDFNIIYSDLDEVDKVFNNIMDGELFVY